MSLRKKYHINIIASLIYYSLSSQIFVIYTTKMCSHINLHKKNYLPVNVLNKLHWVSLLLSNTTVFLHENRLNYRYKIYSKMSLMKNNFVLEKCIVTTPRKFLTKMFPCLKTTSTIKSKWTTEVLTKKNKKETKQSEWERGEEWLKWKELLGPSCINSYKQGVISKFNYTVSR